MFQKNRGRVENDRYALTVLVNNKEKQESHKLQSFKKSNLSLKTEP